MRIEITAAFNDLTKSDEEDRRVEVGTKMTVTAERGVELVGLGLALDITTHDDPSSSKSSSTTTK